MNKRKFLKTVLTGMAGVLSSATYANTKGTSLPNNQHRILLIPPEALTSPVFSKDELKKYLSSINELNKDLNTGIQTVVFRPASAKEVILNPNQYTKSLHKKACSYYNSKLFYRAITKNTDEQPGDSTLLQLIKVNYKSLSNFNAHFINEVHNSHDDFAWVILNKITMQLSISSGKVYTATGLSDNRFTVLAVDMRKETYSRSYKNKKEYLNQVMNGLNWQVLNKRVNRFIG